MPPKPLCAAIVDYGAGNLRSVAKALERSGFRALVSGEAEVIRTAQAVVLPGVGAFADAVTSLRKTGLDDAVREAIEARRPYLGLCLGLQVLFDASEEHGVNPGLGLLAGQVCRFPEKDENGRRLHVPHIGWNRVRFAGRHAMLDALGRSEAEDEFYFVHSYHAVPERAADTVGTADYGGRFTAAVARDNVFAVQFHPEKSQGAGRRLLDAFATWVGQC